MFRGSMRLVVDQWGKVEAAELSDIKANVSASSEGREGCVRLLPAPAPPRQHTSAGFAPHRDDGRYGQCLTTTTHRPSAPCCLCVHFVDIQQPVLDRVRTCDAADRRSCVVIAATSACGLHTCRFGAGGGLQWGHPHWLRESVAVADCRAIPKVRSPTAQHSTLHVFFQGGGGAFISFHAAVKATTLSSDRVGDVGPSW